MAGFLTNEVMGGGDWRGFERVTARLLGHMGFRDVQTIGGSGDMGGDTLAVRSDGRTLVVQCKSVTGDRLVGPRALEEAFNASAYYGCDMFTVATNGDFTHSATKKRDDYRSLGYNALLWNGGSFRQTYDRLDMMSRCRRVPRPHQMGVIEKLGAAWDEGRPRALFVMATGLGKTITVATAAQHFWEAGARRMLVLCHMQDLALQLEQGFWSQLSKEVPTSVFLEGERPSEREGITFGLYQTFRGWLPSIDPKTYDVVIVDEAHHAMSRGFSGCLRHLWPRLLVGMTATPWRGDGRAIESLFGEPLETISLVDGMRMGYLAKVDYRIFCDNIDWKGVQSISRKSLTIHDLNKRLFLPQRDDAVIDGILEAMEEIENPRIAVFSPSIEHGRRFADALTAAGVRCRPLSGVNRAQRRSNLMAFSSGSISAVTAVDVLNEGIDVPDVNILVFLRPTNSRRIFLQQLGRGLRVAEDKDRAIVLDFVSDIRNIAYAIEIDNEAREKDRETLVFKDKIVSFTNERIGDFVTTWLEDVASDDYDDDRILLFPGLG